MIKWQKLLSKTEGGRVKDGERKGEVLTAVPFA